MVTLKPARQRQVLYLNPRELEPSRENVRFDIGDIAGLAESIREHGVLQPLGVAEHGAAYQVVYGNRRRDAAVVVGLDSVPCLLLEGMGDEDQAVAQLLENVQRLELNDMEKGRAFLRLRERIAEREGPEAGVGTLNAAVAKQLGLSPRTVQRYIALTSLADGVQERLLRGDLNVTQAQHIVGIDDPWRQEAVGKLAADENLSAADVSRLCQALAKNANIGVDEAWQLVRSGKSVAEQVAAAPAADAPARLAPRPKAEESESDDDLWDDEPEAEEPAAPFRDATPQERGTADGNRRFRIRSLDSFMDELDRLTRAVEDGDLVAWLKDDPAGPLKVHMAIKQAHFIARSLQAFVGEEVA